MARCCSRPGPACRCGRAHVSCATLLRVPALGQGHAHCSVASAVPVAPRWMSCFQAITLLLALDACRNRWHVAGNLQSTQRTQQPKSSHALVRAACPSQRNDAVMHPPAFLRIHIQHLCARVWPSHTVYYTRPLSSECPAVTHHTHASEPVLLACCRGRAWAVCPPHP